MRKVILLLWVCALGLRADELLYLVPEVSWLGKNPFIRYSNRNPVVLDLEKRTQRKIPSPAKRVDFVGLKKIITEGSAATSPRAPFLVGEKILAIEYDSVKSEDTSLPSRGLATVRSQEGDFSAVVARFEYSRSGSRPMLFPLENGKWFAINIDGEKSGRPTEEVFFHLRADEKNFLTYDDVLDSGLGSLLKNQWVRLAIRRAQPILFTESYAVLCLYDYGLFWSIRLKDGQLSGPFRLYSSITDKQIVEGTVLRPIVSLQPTPDGRIIFVARPEDCMAKGSELLKRIVDYQQQIVAGVNAGNARDSLKSVRAMWDSLYTSFPFVHWMELNPATGSIKRLNPPPFGAREMINTQQEFDSFFWLMDARDDVQFLDPDLSSFKEGGAKPPAEAPQEPPEPRKAPKKGVGNPSAQEKASPTSPGPASGP